MELRMQPVRITASSEALIYTSRLHKSYLSQTPNLLKKDE